MHNCIYCGEDGPFTKVEHVFPYSLGGGGEGWTLADTVCDDCNHGFSKAEEHLARQSLESLSREIYGPKGRKRKKEEGKRHLFSTGSYCIAKESKLAYEASASSKGFSATASAQIILTQKLEGGEALLEEVQNTTEQYKVLKKSILDLIQSSFIIVNVPESFKQYSATLTKEGEIKLSEAKSPLPKNSFVNARRDTLYVENLPSSNQQERYTPRIFKQANRNITIKADSLIEAIEFFSVVVKHLYKSGAASLPQDIREISIESIKSCGSLDPVLVFQAIAKTGINFIARMYGSKFARKPAFDEIKGFVRNPESNLSEALSFVQITLDHPMMFLLKAINVPETHSMMTVFIPKAGVFFLIQFYGSSRYIVKLGDVSRPNEREDFEIVLVHYNKRETHHLNPIEIVEMTTSVSSSKIH